MNILSNIHKIQFHVASLVILVSSMSLLMPDETSAQERTMMRMEFKKDTRNDKIITITLFSGRGKNRVLLEDALVTLTASNNDTTVQLAQVNTNSEGIAELKIENGYQFPLDEEGFTMIEASYEGTDDYRSTSRDIDVKDLSFDLDFDIIDSVKTVSVKATELDADGNEVPVEGLYIYIGVQRLYSILPVGEVMTSEDGVYSIEFPEDLPGDSSGNYTVVARIMDNDYYGTVEKRGEIQWGLPVSYEIKPLPRKLWTDEAPLWMIFSVFIILAGAWFHFFLSIHKLNKIKKVAKDPAS